MRQENRRLRYKKFLSAIEWELSFVQKTTVGIIKHSLIKSCKLRYADFS